MGGGGVLASLDVNVLSLLPRTLGSRYSEIVASCEGSEEKEFEVIRRLFKSMISGDHAKPEEAKKQISSKHVEPTEAREQIVDPPLVMYEGHSEIENINPMDQVRERRQGLGRKRARFSFKPKTCNPVVNVGTTINLDQIKDPEEFFAAVERMEYAAKVLKKMRGEVINGSTENPDRTLSRKCRPGLLGRKASFKHNYRVQAESSEVTLTPQREDSALGSLECAKDPKSNPISLATSQHQEKGSTTEEEENVDHVLKNLLYCFEDINEGEEVKFLERKLQVDSINVDRIRLPALDRCHGNNIAIMACKKTQEILGSSEKIPRNVTRSPLASIASFKRHVLQKDLFMESFNMESLSDSSSENSPLSKGTGSHLSSKSRSRLHNKRKSLSSADEIQSTVRTSPHASFTDAKISHHQCDESNDARVTLEKFRDKLDCSLQEASVSNEMPLPEQALNFGALSGQEVHMSEGVDIPMQVDKLLDKSSESNETDLPEKDSQLGTSRQKDPASNEVDLSEQESQLGEMSGLVRGRSSSDRTVDHGPGPLSFEAGVEADKKGDDADPDPFDSNMGDCKQGEGPLASERSEPTTASVLASYGKVAHDSSLGNDVISRCPLMDDASQFKVCGVPESNRTANEDQSSADGASNVPFEKVPENSDAVHGHYNEVANHPISMPSVEQEAHPEKETKSKNAKRRQSLAGAGTAWQSGVRRSTRIRTRPLAHWRGERLLYARIHDSLPTVIGIKYASPAKTSREEAALKVKSFVSEEYAELLQKVALH